MKRIVILALGFTFACAKDLKPPDSPDAGGTTGGHFAVTDLGGGKSQIDVESESHTDWHYFDIETLKEVTPATPDDSAEWDLAFQRYLIRTNGGISGTGGMEVGFDFDHSFDQVTEAIAGPYITDINDTDRDVDTDPDYAFNTAHAKSETGWYLYNENDHTLAPTPMVYIVKTVGGNYVKIEFTGYYLSGTAGHPQFHIASIGPPSNAGTIAVDVTGPSFVHLGIAQNAVVEIAAPMTSVDWDLGVDEAAWQTNSSAARAGKGGARTATASATWDNLSSAPTVGYVTDKMIPFPGAPGSGRFLGNSVLSEWYIYDAVNHTAASKGLIYFVRTAGGTYGKFQILNYDNPTKVYTVRVATLTREVEVETAMIDARPIARWTYFSLRLGTTVEPMDALTDETWDVAFEREKIKTNSGVSGVGMGGAQLGASNNLADITMAPPSGYVGDVVDTGNAVLAGALMYTGTTTVATDTAYVLKTADGTFAKMKVRAYADGIYTVDWAYAGPGQSAF